MQTKTYAFANSVEPDETAHNEPSHQDPHYLPFGYGFFNDIPICNNEHVNNQPSKSLLKKKTKGWKG